MRICLKPFDVIKQMPLEDGGAKWLANLLVPPRLPLEQSNRSNTIIPAVH